MKAGIAEQLGATIDTLDPPDAPDAPDGAL